MLFVIDAQLCALISISPTAVDSTPWPACRFISFYSV